jgi:outer membrane immunogenic protein
MKRYLALTAAIAALASQPVAAADLNYPLDDTTPAMARSWTGFHAGIHGAYGWTSTDASINIPGVAATGDDAGAFRPGVNLGYDIQRGRMVVGGFVDWTAGLGNLDGNLSVGPLAIGVQADIESSLTVGARLGYLMTQRTLVYGLGGYTWAKTSRADFSLGGITLASLPAGDLSGVTLGAGIEHMLGAGFSLKAEARHTWLDDANITLAPGAAVGLGGRSTSVLMGLSYRF